jgi:hypothetical protein
MRSWKLFFLLHQVPKAASGAGSSFSSGNEWYGLHLDATSVTVPVNGAKVAGIQHEHKSTYLSFANRHQEKVS